MNPTPEPPFSEGPVFPHIIDFFSKRLKRLGRQPDLEEALTLLLFKAAVVDGALDPIIGKSLGGVILTWNKEAENVFGYTAQEAVGRSITMILPLEARDEHHLLLERIQHGERVVSFESRRCCKDGRILDVLLTASPVCDPDGNLVGISSIVRDVTAQKQAAQQALAFEAERERSQVLADFVQNVAHDFRTPLTTIKAGLYVLANLPDPARQQRQLVLMEQQTQRLTDLLEGMLKLTRLDHDPRLNVQRANLNHLAREVYHRKLGAAQQKGLAFHAHFCDESLEAQADADLLGQAVLNLVDNAIRFTPAGGTVILRTIRQAAAVIEVQDDGIGIDESDLPHVFEPLYRADKTRATHTGGIGLGLAVAQKIVRLHGGDIEARSAFGVGSTFRVLLPLSG